VAELEKKTILDALQKANGNQSRAARQLHMTEQSLRYKLRKYGLDSTRTTLRTRHNQRTSI
jgi:DNA-binding NtrC family response regulator